MRPVARLGGLRPPLAPLRARARRHLRRDRLRRRAADRAARERLRARRRPRRLRARCSSGRAGWCRRTSSCAGSTGRRSALAAGAADAVFSCHVLQHLDGPRALATYMAEARRVTRPGGTLMAHIWLSSSPPTGLRRLRQELELRLARRRLRRGERPRAVRMRTYRIEYVQAMLAEAGFAEIELRMLPVRSNGFHHHFWFARVPAGDPEPAPAPRGRGPRRRPRPAPSRTARRERDTPRPSRRGRRARASRRSPARGRRRRRARTGGRCRRRSTISGPAPERAATTGVPAASDSSSTSPNASSTAGSTVAEAIGIAPGQLLGAGRAPATRPRRRRRGSGPLMIGSRPPGEHQARVGDRSRSLAEGLEQQRAALARVAEAGAQISVGSDARRTSTANSPARTPGQRSRRIAQQVARAARAAASLPTASAAAPRDDRAQHLESVAPGDQVLAGRDPVQRADAPGGRRVGAPWTAAQASVGKSAWATSNRPAASAEQHVGDVLEVVLVVGERRQRRHAPGGAPRASPAPRARELGARCELSRVTSWPRAASVDPSSASEALGPAPHLRPVGRVQERDPQRSGAVTSPLLRRAGCALDRAADRRRDLGDADDRRRAAGVRRSEPGCAASAGLAEVRDRRGNEEEERRAPRRALGGAGDEQPGAHQRAGSGGSRSPPRASAERCAAPGGGRSAAPPAAPARLGDARPEAGARRPRARRAPVDVDALAPRPARAGRGRCPRRQQCRSSRRSRRPLEQLARIGDVAGLEPRARRRHLDAARQPGSRWRSSGSGSVRPWRNGRVARRSVATGSPASSGAGRQSSSVNATSGAAVARQPRLRFGAGPAAGRQTANPQALGGGRERPAGAAASRTTITSKRSRSRVCAASASSAKASRCSRSAGRNHDRDLRLAGHTFACWTTWRTFQPSRERIWNRSRCSTLRKPAVSSMWRHPRRFGSQKTTDLSRIAR